MSLSSSSTRAGVRLLVLALGLVALPSCGGAGAPTLYPVSGKALAGGKPLSKGAVRFVPDRNKSNAAGVEPVGTIGADGKYTLMTGGKPGAPLGWYKVTVVSTDELDSTKPNAGKSYVGKQFNAAETTTITIEVLASPPSPEAYDIKVGAPS